jgi:ABC-2 type transport system permease protein
MATTTHLPPAARRTLGLARANALLMRRNIVTLLYAVGVPLLPLALLALGSGAAATTSAVANALLMAALFPVYYNVLSLTVTRRDELVLKRLRTGEARDREILASIALPGLAVMAVVVVLTVVLGSVLGEGAPVNVPLIAVTAMLLAATFSALAVWTAAWTRNAEAAQLTSMPVIVVAVVGSLRPILPDGWRQWVDLTPGGALDRLVRLAWYGDDGTGRALDLIGSSLAAAGPVLVLLAWTALAMTLVRRGMRWEPRS